MTNANLTGAILTKANLYSSTLTNVNLTGANLTNADLTISRLTNANLTGARCDGGETLDGTTYAWLYGSAQLDSTANYQDEV